MIVEDEYGNDIDLRDLDDDREPEPSDPEDEPPVDLGVLTDIHARYLAEGASAEGKEAAQIILDTVPQMIAELHAARAELDRWRDLPTRDEYAVAVGGKQHPDDCTQAWHTDDVAKAEEWASNGTGHAWTRTVTLHPWIGLSAEPPF